MINVSNVKIIIMREFVKILSKNCRKFVFIYRVILLRVFYDL